MRPFNNGPTELKMEIPRGPEVSDTKALVRQLKALCTKLEESLHPGIGADPPRRPGPHTGLIVADQESVKLAEAAAELEPEVQEENPKLPPHQVYAEALRRARAKRRT